VTPATGDPGGTMGGSVVLDDGEPCSVYRELSLLMSRKFDVLRRTYRYLRHGSCFPLHFTSFAPSSSTPFGQAALFALTLCRPPRICTLPRKTVGFRLIAGLRASKRPTIPCKKRHASHGAKQDHRNSQPLAMRRHEAHRFISFGVLP